jgi:transitional endoplasmic reticulum ATPase
MKLMIRDGELEGNFNAVIYTVSNPGFGKYVELRYGQCVCAAKAKFVQSDKEMVYVDKWLRQFIDARNNDWVEVERWEPVPAKMISLAPLKRVRLDEEELAYFSILLSNNPVCKGLVFPRHYPNGDKKEIQVTKTQPGGIVLVQHDTEILLDEEPPPPPPSSSPCWSDIGGLEKEIALIRRLVEYPLRHPEVYSHFGIEPPKGLLLYGPPGTGKTLIAKALANEARAHIEIIQGPEVVAPFHGESERILRERFEKARSNRPAIILIDEIDSLVPKRGLAPGEVDTRLTATMLTLMDGLRDMTGVVVIGTTNRPDQIDPALRRPGRFEREIMIGAPDKTGRSKILTIHTKNMPLAPDVNLDSLAEATTGFTGADIASLRREAGHSALRRYFSDADLESGHLSFDSQMTITHQDFTEGMKNVQPTAMRGTMVEVVRDVTLDDIGGLSEAKNMLIENIQLAIKETRQFESIGHRLAKGALLYGRSGTGKTLLARALANACGVHLITLRGPEIHRKWFGESEELVRSIFAKAREVAPCILLLDEVDSLAPVRGRYVSDLRESITTQVIIELERIGIADQVFVIATTNQPEMVDPALRRPGRLDVEIPVQKPNEAERQEIFDIKLKKVKLDTKVDLASLAKKAVDFSGADIAECCRRAALQALKRADLDPEKTVVTLDDLEEAIAKIQQTDRFKRKDMGF